MSAIFVWRWFHAYGWRDNYAGGRRRGSWARTATIAKETGLAESTVRTIALPWLIRHGWLVPQELEIQGEKRVMHWCAWQVCHPASGVVDMGHGVKVRASDNRATYDKEGHSGPATPAPKKERRPRRPRAPAPPLFSAEGAAACAHADAPNSSNEFKGEFEPLTLTRPCPAGEGSRIPDAIVEPSPDAPGPIPPAVPATPAPRQPDPPEVCLAALATAPLRFPVTAARALWDLVDQGVPLPAAWAKVTMPPRPTPDPEAAAPSAAPPPPRPAPLPAAPTTEDLIRRIAEPCGPDAVAARVREISGRMAETLGDQHSRNYYAKILAQAAAGEVKIKPILTAYLVAKKSDTARKKGAIFADKLRELRGGPA